MTSQLNVRIPVSTQEQLETLIADTGMTQTQIVILAIDRFYQTREREKAMSEKTWTAQRFDYDRKPLYESVSVVGSTVGVATGSAIRVMDYRGWKSGVLVVISDGPDFEQRQQEALTKHLEGI